jgi:hypothetical protein
LAEDYFSKKYFPEEISAENFGNRKNDCQILFFPQVFRRHHSANDPVNGIDPEGLQKRLVFSGGRLSLYNDDGSLMGTWNATSGPFGKGRLPSGLYGVGNFRDNRTTKGMVCPGSGSGYSVDLSPQMSTVGDRTNLEIHPDQPPIGTKGCIGVSCGNGDAGDFGNVMRNIFNQPMSPDIILEVR